MKTRLDICARCWHVGLTDGVPMSCALITCCSAPELPSPADFARRVNHPQGKCPHPDGDKWREAEVPEDRPLAGSTTDRPLAGATQLNGLQLMVLQRARCCKGSRERERCVAHYVASYAPWGCDWVGMADIAAGVDSNDIRPQIKDPSWACPRGHFNAERGTRNAEPHSVIPTSAFPLPHSEVAR